MESSTSITLPAWYESTKGPQISSTIANIAGTVLPVANLLLSSFDLGVIPNDGLNALISVVVFVYFAVMTAVNYVRAKARLGAQIARLENENRELGLALGRVDRGSAEGSSSDPRPGFRPAGLA